METLKHNRTSSNQQITQVILAVCYFEEAGYLETEMSSSKQPLLVGGQGETLHYNSLNSEDSGKRNEIVEYRPHPLRWYILAVLCVMNFSNAMVSGTMLGLLTIVD